MVSVSVTGEETRNLGLWNHAIVSAPPVGDAASANLFKAAHVLPLTLIYVSLIITVWPKLCVFDQFAVYLPIILRDTLKFSLAASQCLIAPPYAFAGFLMMACAWYADKYQVRAPVLMFNSCIALIGVPMAGFVTNPWARYVGVFLAVSAINSNIPLLMAYQVCIASTACV